MKLELWKVGASVLALSTAWLGAACIGSTGTPRFAFAATVGGAPRDASQPLVFDNDYGWTITLEKAEMTIGPIYLNTVLPLNQGTGAGATGALRRFLLGSAFAASGSHLGDGRVVGEVLSQITVDVVSPSLVRFPVDGAAVQERAGSLDLLFYPPPGSPPELVKIPTSALRVVGRAERTDDAGKPHVVPFSGHLVLDDTWLPTSKPGTTSTTTIEDIRTVRGIDSQLALREGGSLELRVDPRRLFDGCDFGAVEQNPSDPEDPSRKQLVQSKTGTGTDQVMKNLYQNLHASRGTYAARWSSDPVTAPYGTAGGTGGGGGAGGAGGGPAAGLQPFTPPGPAGPGTFRVTASGEGLATKGFAFQAGTSKSEDPAFVDGWAVSFSHVLVTYGSVALAEGPDTDPSDKSKLGAEVARATGPWAVDLTKGNEAGKSGEQVTALAVLDGAFSSTARYAVSYDVVPATAQAKNVNLDAAALALYQTAIERGFSVVYVGTATYQGPAPAPGSVFEKMPKVVSFTIGMKNPTTAINCENPDLGASGIGEDFARGAQTLASGPSILQLTTHLDHAFWDRLNEEGAPVHFDQLAAVASTYGTPSAPPGVVTIDDLEGLDHTAFVTRAKEPLPARSLVSDYAAPAGTLSFDANGSKFPKSSYGAFLRYSQAAGYHLNADGECLIRRNFLRPAPP